MPNDWSNQEEVVTITGFLEGVVDVKRELSETAVLEETGRPLRWSHSRIAYATKPEPADMAKFYGAGWDGLRFAAELGGK